MKAILSTALTILMTLIVCLSPVFCENNGLMIDTNGNIGIGTASPEAKLDVQGNIIAVPTIFEVYPSVHGPAGATGYNKVQHNTINLDTNPGTFTLNPDHSITVNKAGYYRVYQRVLVYKLTTGDFYSQLTVNASHAGFLGHTVNSLTYYVDSKGEREMYLAAGTVLIHKIYTTASTQYIYHKGDTNCDYTHMRITRLN